MVNKKDYEERERYAESLYSEEYDLWNCSKLEELAQQDRMYRIMEDITD